MNLVIKIEYRDGAVPPETARITTLSNDHEFWAAAITDIVRRCEGTWPPIEQIVIRFEPTVVPV